MTEITCPCGGYIGTVERTLKGDEQLVKEYQGRTFIWIGHGHVPCSVCGRLREWHSSPSWLARYVKQRTGIDILDKNI